VATRPYEVMFIVDTTLDDQVVQNVVNRSIEQMKGIGAEVSKIEKWGRRKLAYPIRKKADGYYTLVQMTAEPANIAELDRKFFLADELLRHKIMQLPVAGFDRTLAQPPPLEEIPSGGGRDRD
jgi:small subunit ribosomal protein S6